MDRLTIIVISIYKDRETDWRVIIEHEPKCEKGEPTDNRCVYGDGFGKTVFFTEEEAQSALNRNEVDK